jgi:flagellar biosynthetic protein FliR
MIPWGLTNLSVLLPAFLLVAARISGVFLSAPLLGSVIIPARIRAATAVAVTATIFPVVWPALPVDLSLAEVAVGLTGELLIGMVLGLGLDLVVMAAHTAGLIVGQQAGLSLAAVFNPHSDIESTTIGEVFLITATVAFVALGGDRQLLQALLDSFASVPVMSFSAGDHIVGVVGDLLTSSLKLALKIAGPAVLALLLAQAGLGFLSRTMPQLHILSVGFVLLVAIGLIMSGLAMGSTAELLAAELSEACALLRAALGIGE